MPLSHEQFHALWAIHPNGEENAYTRRCVDQAIEDVRSSYGLGMFQAYKFLKIRLQRYRRSPLVGNLIRSGGLDMIPSMATWMRGRYYHDDDDVWQYQIGTSTFDKDLERARQ